MRTFKSTIAVSTELAWFSSSVRAAVVLTLTSLVVASSSVACTIGETRYETVTLPPRMKTEVRVCSSPLTSPDLSTLKACGDGKGHCYDANKTAIPADQLKPCDDPTTSCIPDSFLHAPGHKLKSCSFFIGGKPGACVSVLLKQVEDNVSVLQKDVCNDDERCAPCINPVDGTDTGLCSDQIGVHEQNCVGGPGSEAPACCHGMGDCIREDAVPEDQRSHLDQETCKHGLVCAPASLTSGKPVKCDVLGFSGVCLDVCFAEIFRTTTQVTRSSCGPTELCLPCVLGKGQGLPGCD